MRRPLASRRPQGAAHCRRRSSRPRSARAEPSLPHEQREWAMDSTDATTEMWASIAERAAREGRDFELTVRFSGDNEGRATATIVVGSDGPRVRLSAAALDAFDRVEPDAIASSLATPK